MDEVREVADPSQRVVLVCNMGGSLDPAYAPSKFGMQSRHAAFQHNRRQPAAAAMHSGLYKVGKRICNQSVLLLA